jgi:uncharacterized protein YecT (DUF1311 family)
MAKKVFVSHSSKDSKIATAICMALESRGHQCWLSSRDIKPGENFQGAIVRAIREAGVMVLVFSNNANSSDEIKKEIVLASQARMMVIPVRAEDVLPSEDFTYELATRQWIDMFVDWERAIEVLSQQVGVGAPRDDIDTRPPPPAAPATEKDRQQVGAEVSREDTGTRPPPSAPATGKSRQQVGAAVPREDTGTLPPPLPSSPGAGKNRTPVFAVIAVLLLAGGAVAFWSSRPSAPPPAPSLAAPSATVATLAAKPTVQKRRAAPALGMETQSQSQLAALDNGAQAAKAEPSFSCAGAAGQAQQIICADPGLAAMDVEIAALYTKARTDAVDTAPLADEQSAWLDRRDHCTDAGCLHQSYAQRRAEIGRWLGGGN